jgi:hypothetical protein
MRSVELNELDLPSVRATGVRWPMVAGVVALCLYFLVAHGCHGDDVDHELLVAPPSETQSFQLSD